MADGSPKQAGSITLAHTYAACLEQPGARLFYGTAALKNLEIYGCDCSNAFAEAPAPKAPLFLRIDQQYREWWEEHKGNSPLPSKSLYVKVNHAIQGHPESPRLWQEFINNILIRKMKFKATTHEPCIYRKILPDGTEILISRQVDDIAVAAKNKNAALEIIKEIGSYMTVPIKEEGLVELFNGINVTQSKHNIKIHVTSYLERVFERHKLWMKNFPVRNEPLPMKPDKQVSMELEQTQALLDSNGDVDLKEIERLEKEYGFQYRSATGELIFAMVTARPDISFATVKLCQYNSKPAKPHFEAVRHLLLYLRDTKHDGITFWRKTPNNNLPQLPFPTTRKEEFNNTEPQIALSPEKAHVYADSDWAGDTKHRKSVSGIGIFFAGAAILYKTMFQKPIAMSSTEAEFYSLSDAGKMTLYIRSILDDLGIDQEEATQMFEDNRGCIQLASVHQPTKRSQHIDVREFAILDWVETDLLNIVSVETARNAADAFTKPLSKILFHRHFDVIMGKRRPLYSSQNRETRKRQYGSSNSPTTVVRTTDATINIIDTWDIWNILCLDTDSQGGVS